MTIFLWGQHSTLRRMRESHRFLSRRIRLKIKSIVLLAILAVGCISFTAFVIKTNMGPFNFPEARAGAGSNSRAGAEAFMESGSSEYFSWQFDTSGSELNETLLIAPKNFSSDYDFVYVVHSRVQDRGQRDAIRKSWAQDVRRSGIGCVVFLLGYNASFQTQAQDEADTYNDIVQYDFIESYGNLTRKSVAMLRWVGGALSNNSILVKTDDDVSINVSRLQTTLRALKETTPEFIAGKLLSDTRPIRNPENKWFVSHDDYLDDKYPPYMSGCLYIISSNLIASMLQASKTTKLMSMEDVYITGILGDKLRLLRIDLRGINSYEDVKPCEMHNQLARHYVSAVDLIEDHRVLTTTIRICQNWFLFGRCWCDSSVRAVRFHVIESGVNSNTIGKLDDKSSESRTQEARCFENMIKVSC